MFLEAFLGCLLGLVVFHNAYKTYQHALVWWGRKLLKKKIVRLGIKSEGGHYFRDGICLVCKMPEAIFRMPGNEGKFTHPDPFKDW